MPRVIPGIVLHLGDRNIRRVRVRPNRFDATISEFKRTGKITEARVAHFSEYVDVLFPLTKELKFRIVPTAGWSRPMDIYRTTALKRIEDDPSRSDEWRAYQQANHRADSLVAQHGADNSWFINSASYDSIPAAAHEPYNRPCNSEPGPGGWRELKKRDDIALLEVAHFLERIGAKRN